MLGHLSTSSLKREINEHINEMIALQDREIEEIRDEMEHDTYDLEHRICSIR